MVYQSTNVEIYYSLVVTIYIYIINYDKNTKLQNKEKDIGNADEVAMH